MQTALAAGLPAGDDRVLLVIDQFEELFMSTPEIDRTRFLDNLSALAEDAHGRVHIVSALRADFYERPRTHQRRVPALPGSGVQQ